LAKLEYSQIVRRKLKKLRSELTQRISSQYDVESDYSYIFVEHNYFFYRLTANETILILEMFHEKEDFMRKLFGIVTTSQETIDYWKE